jgi:DsbC/DsbD-like thiol-disulfide interchange protein
LPNDPKPADHSKTNRTKILRHARNNELTDRRSAAADAKASLLTAYRAARTAAEPSQSARQAERISLVEAREARRAERERVKHEELTRIEALAAQEQAAAAVEIEARQSAENARISRVVEDEAARNAERDRRYAARKARQA